jgi:hypothetical protein
LTCRLPGPILFSKFDFPTAHDFNIELTLHKFNENRLDDFLLKPILNILFRLRVVANYFGDFSSSVPVRFSFNWDFFSLLAAWRETKDKFSWKS